MEEKFSRRILKRACFSEIVKVVVFEELAACATRDERFANYATVSRHDFNPSQNRFRPTNLDG